MKPVFRRLAIILLLLCLALPLMVNAAPRAYQEGIDLYLAQARGYSQTVIELQATKFVDGQSRYTILHIRYKGPTPGFGIHWRIFETTVVLPGDPDQLEVSRDLGWGGLDGVAWVEQRVLGGGTETIELAPVEFHIDLYGYLGEGSTYDGALFHRNAQAVGTVTVAGRTIQIDNGQLIGPENIVHASNFTDQWPGR
jgi:hypothetical protein